MCWVFEHPQRNLQMARSFEVFQRLKNYAIDFFYFGAAQLTQVEQIHSLW